MRDPSERDPSENVTRMLMRLSAGDKQVFDKIVSILYRELTLLASRIIRDERKGHILETRALVDEAYIKLVPCNFGHWKTRKHFLMAAAKAMRHILVDYARRDNARKRGGKIVIHSLNDVDSREYAKKNKAYLSNEFEVVNKALENFSSNGYRRKNTIIQFHYFLQMNHKEIAETMSLSTKTVQRELQFSLAWLNREMKRIVDNG